MNITNERRNFLRLGIANLFGIPLSKIATTMASAQDCSPAILQVSKAKSMILLWLDGAPSTIDMWDPKPDAPDSVRGDFATISTRISGIQFSEHLPKSADILDRCTLIRTCHHSIPEHGPGSQLMLTGRVPSPAIQYPSLAAVSSKWIDGVGTLPANIAFNSPAQAEAGYLGSAWNALDLRGSDANVPIGLALSDSTNRDDFVRRNALRRKLDQRFDRLDGDQVALSLKSFQDQAAAFLQEDSIRKALDLSNEPEEVLSEYGLGSMVGRNVLKARRLIEAGARFVTVGFSGWDTHNNNFPQLRNILLPQLDRVFGGLVMDLERRGLLDSTIVCCCGEFGRTPIVNGSGGRDHWSKAFSVLVAGGGFQSGMVYGETDKFGHEPIELPCTPSQLCATLLKALGIDPNAKLATSSGRPIRILDEQAIDALLV